MSSVLKFFKKKIKPFKKCVSNSTDFGGGGGIASNNEKSTRYSSTYVPARHFSLVETTYQQQQQQSDEIDDLFQSKSYETTENIQYEFNEKSVDGDSDVYCLTNVMPLETIPLSNDELSDDFNEALSNQKLNESSPIIETISSSKDNILFNLNEDAITQRKRGKKQIKPLNGTYTIDKQIQVRSDCEDDKTVKTSSTVTSTSSDENLLNIIEEESIKSKNVDSVSTSSGSTADALYDPFFSSTLKLSPSNLTTITREESRRYENAQATMYVSKQAQKRCLIEKLTQKHRLSKNSAELSILNRSAEKMRRSISLPGVAQQISPVLGNISKISTVKDQTFEATSGNESQTPLNTLVNSEYDDDLLDSFMISNENLLDNKSRTPTQSQIEDLFGRASRSLNRSNSLAATSVPNASFTTFEEFADDEHTCSQAQTTSDEYATPSRSSFTRGGPMRMSKTIKQMFKNVVKYQMNALGCLEKFYEAQVMKLETDRRRDLALNPQKRKEIVEFYDQQLQELEDRVYTNLKYICRNRCAGSMASDEDSCESPKFSKALNHKAAYMQRRQLRQNEFQSNLNINVDDSSEESNESTFKRQYSLPYSRNNKVTKAISVESAHASDKPPRPKYNKNDDSPTRKKAQKKYYSRPAQHALNHQNQHQQQELSDDQSNEKINLYSQRNKRQIKSASSLQMLSEQENNALNKKRQILTNGSLNLVMQTDNYYDRRFSNTFKRYDLNEILIESSQSPIQTRRHTFGSDKYSHLRNQLRHSHTDNHIKLVLKETQV